jgi:1-acyl-sn-glycerol-3-phosphate acyltransferase
VAEPEVDDQPEATSPIALLSWFERFAFRVSAWLNDGGQRLAAFYQKRLLFPFLWIFIGRRLEVRGLERLAALEHAESFLLVANHRTFFDLFVLSWILVGRRGLRQRVSFPVRSNFFYENPLGLLISIVLSGGSMFPPIFRSPKKRAFNQYAVDLMSERLRQPGTMIGFHPEGTRSKGDDPYELLPAQPGAGKLVLEARPLVVPAFVTGLTNSLGREFLDNLRGRRKVVCVFGAPIDPAVWPEGNRLALQKRVSDELLDRIRALQPEERAARGVTG